MMYNTNIHADMCVKVKKSDFCKKKRTTKRKQKVKQENTRSFQKEEKRVRNGLLHLSTNFDEGNTIISSKTTPMGS